MKTRFAAAVLVTSALVFTLTLGCGQPKAATCVPSQAIACVGAAGCRGGQTCRADGLGYEACDCGSGGDAGATGGGAGGGVGGGTGGGTGGSFDAGAATEQEPNDGAGVGELDALTAPGAKSGTIGRANDVDIFMVALTAGQQWRWRVDAHGSSLEPHLSVTEAQGTVPVLVARGSAGGVVEIEQLVLKTGSYAVIVRDSRNVPSSGSQGVGSAQHSYVVSGEASTRTPVLIAVPSTTAGGLTTRYATALHRFTLAASTAVTLQALATTKTPPSDLDTRLTLFSTTTNQWLGTNDDASGTNTDSKLTGTLPAGSYLVVVDNVSETATDLSFELSATSP